MSECDINYLYLISNGSHLVSTSATALHKKKRILLQSKLHYNPLQHSKKIRFNIQAYDSSIPFCIDVPEKHLKLLLFTMMLMIMHCDLIHFVSLAVVSVKKRVYFVYCHFYKCKIRIVL